MYSRLGWLTCGGTYSFRPALDADSFFNPEDLTVDPNARAMADNEGMTRSASSGEGDRPALDHEGRRSSLALVWDFVMSKQGGWKGVGSLKCLSYRCRQMS